MGTVPENPGLQRHFNLVLMSVPTIINDLLDEGVMVQSMISGLIQVAKKVA